MYLGTIVELTSSSDLYANPLHPYTKALLRAVPIPDPEVAAENVGVLKGEVPSIVKRPAGCPFYNRCDCASARCAEEMPPLLETEPGHFAACFAVNRGE